MQFHVTSRFGSLPARKDCFVLKEDNWDDFGFKAAYELVHVDSEGVSHEIGFLHIGCKGQESGRASVPKKFDQLDDEFFSLEVMSFTTTSSERLVTQYAKVF